VPLGRRRESAAHFQMAAVDREQTGFPGSTTRRAPSEKYWFFPSACTPQPRALAHLRGRALLAAQQSRHAQATVSSAQPHDAIQTSVTGRACQDSMKWLATPKTR
jgi:hypothetical protein